MARLQCLRFDQAGWAELGLETPSASHFVGVRDGALTHYYRPSQSAFFEDLAESTPEQDAETLRRLAKMIDALPHSLRECFDRRFASSNDVDERADERVLAKSRLECEVKQEVRGKLVNDKYRTTFVWYDESEVQALLKVLSDPESGWALFAVDSNITNAMRPTMVKLYVGLDISNKTESDAPLDRWDVQWKERRCPLEIAVMHHDTLQMVRQADLHSVYRMMRLNDAMRRYHTLAAAEKAVAERESSRRSYVLKGWRAELARAVRALQAGNCTRLMQAVSALVTELRRRPPAVARPATHTKSSAAETFKEAKRRMRELLKIDQNGNSLARQGSESAYEL